MGNRGVFDFRVRSYECGADGLATLPSVCNYFQQAAGDHSRQLGISIIDFAAAGYPLVWVLTRMFVSMQRYPKWCDEVVVETFPRSGRKLITGRDYLLRGADGTEFGRATSEWVVIDLSTRKLRPIPEMVFSMIDPNNQPLFEHDPFTPRLRFPEMPTQSPVDPLAFRVQRSHIDLNGHVNNVHYIEWMLEAAPERRIGEMEIVFRSETLAGEEVLVSAVRDGDAYCHRVFSRDGRDHVIARTRKI